jgi:hypothetical protein
LRAGLAAAAPFLGRIGFLLRRVRLGDGVAGNPGDAGLDGAVAREREDFISSSARF